MRGTHKLRHTEHGDSRSSFLGRICSHLLELQTISLLSPSKFKYLISVGIVLVLIRLPYISCFHFVIAAYLSDLHSIYTPRGMKSLIEMDGISVSSSLPFPGRCFLPCWTPNSNSVELKSHGN